MIQRFLSDDHNVISTRNDLTVDTARLFKIALRYLPFLLSFATGGAVVSLLLTANTEKSWQGHFKILIKEYGDQSQNFSSLLSKSAIGGVTGLGKNKDLITELEIIQSRSVLYPIYNKYNSNPLGSSKSSPLSFDKWIERKFEFSLPRNSSVLTISYTDHSKARIIPLLNDVVNAIRSYSTSEKLRKLRSSVNFTKDQVQKFSQVEAESSRRLDAFKIKYGISDSKAIGGDPAALELDSMPKSETSNNLILPNLRSGLLPNKVGASDTFDRIASVSQELIRRKEIYTAKDPTVIALENELKVLKKFISSTANGLIGLPDLDNRSSSQELALQYYKLQRDASKNSQTLTALEAKLRGLEIQEAQESVPWRLVSKPTLSPDYVSPSPLKNIGLGLISGFTLGALVALFIDRTKEIVYQPEEAQSILKPTRAISVDLNNRSGASSTVKLIFDNEFKTESVCLLIAGLVEDWRVASLAELFKSAGAQNVVCCKSVLEASSYRKFILVAISGSTTRSMLTAFSQDLALTEKENQSLIWLA